MGRPRKWERPAVGQRFGLLTVTGYTTSRAVCECDCGAIKEVPAAHLQTGRVKSCGCRQRDYLTARGADRASYRRQGSPRTTGADTRGTEFDAALWAELQRYRDKYGALD